MDESKTKASGDNYELSGDFQGATINIKSNISHGTTSPNQPTLDTTTEFIVSNIRQLLLTGFNEQELRHVLPSELSKFKESFQYIKLNPSFVELVAHLIEWAERKRLMSSLLDWAQKRNSDVYEEHQPYWRE